MNLPSQSSLPFNLLRCSLRQARVPAFLAVLVCLIPLLAMQFTAEVAWSRFDFVVAFVLLFGGGFTYNLLIQRLPITSYKLALGLTVGTAVFLLYLNGAVGFVGSEGNGINLIFPGVLVVLATRVWIAGLSPAGMARALLATGFVQGGAGLIVLLTGGYQLPGASLVHIVGLTVFFMALWFTASYIFKRAAAGGNENTVVRKPA